MTRSLAVGYAVDVDRVIPGDWYDIAAGFTDVNIYQVWQPGSPARRSLATSTLVLKFGGSVAAAAEVRLFRLPLTERGIAYVRWGPLFRQKSGNANPEHFRQFVRALRNEYACRRRMVLRMNPRLFTEQHHDYLEIMREEGFTAVPGLQTERTLLVDLNPEIEDLRRGFDKKWRNCLSKAEKAGLSITTGRELELFDEFGALYAEMLDRKRFRETADLQAHRGIQAAVPTHLKMHVVIAREGNQACAGAVVSALGNTALYLFGATNDTGMRTSASYLVQWEILKLLKAHAVPVYDLHGINPETNPGTYHFKRGLAGKTGTEVSFGGQIQAFEPSISNYSVLLVEKWQRRRRTAAATGPAERPLLPLSRTAGA
jgi:lipid II:glycine glycyltransferase (peptidoglycan interpeptide bridge formation enzyme)